MSITPFGLVFMTLGFTLLATRRTWLLPLLVVSAGLHAYAVAIIGPATQAAGLGISPWLFTCVLIFIHLIAKVVQHRHLDLGASHQVKLLFFGWMLYTGWCVLSAFSLPFVFAGIPVNGLSRWDGFYFPPEPLVWNRVNAVQAANSAIIGTVMVYVLQLAKDPLTAKRIFAGFGVALALTVNLGLYQRLQHTNIAPALDFFTQSLNPSYQQNLMLNQFGGSNLFLRLNWPFSEPSYASVWYAGMLSGGLALYLFSRRPGVGLLLFISGLAGLGNSMGGTGIAGTIGAFLVLLGTAILTVFRQKQWRNLIVKRLAIFALLAGVAGAGYPVLSKLQPQLPNMGLLLSEMIRERVSGVDETRPRSNREALIITRETWGLGVGLGSNRASSYLLSMASNIGIPGLVLFIVLLAQQTLLVARTVTSTGSTTGYLVLGGSAATFIGMALGIPDLNFPAWWIWIIGGFGVVASNAAWHSRHLTTARRISVTAEAGENKRAAGD